jgi:hypothetical protein
MILRMNSGLTVTPPRPRLDPTRRRTGQTATRRFYFRMDCYDECFRTDGRKMRWCEVLPPFYVLWSPEYLSVCRGTQIPKSVPCPCPSGLPNTLSTFPPFHLSTFPPFHLPSFPPVRPGSPRVSSNGAERQGNEEARGDCSCRDPDGVEGTGGGGVGGFLLAAAMLGATQRKGGAVRRGGAQRDVSATRHSCVSVWPGRERKQTRRLGGCGAGRAGC